MTNRSVHLHRLLSVITIAAALAGSWQTLFIAGKQTGNDIFYFTIQSNIWIALIHIYFLLAETAEAGGRGRIPNAMRTLRYVLTVSIALTFLIFFVVLVPELGVFVVSLPGSIPTHLIAPLAAIADFILFEHRLVPGSSLIRLSLLPPLIYVIALYTLSAFGVTFIGGEPVPYFFLNYHELGWFRIRDSRMGVAYWLVLLAGVVLALASLILWLNKRVRARHSHPD